MFLKKYVQDFSGFFKIFQDFLSFIKDLEWCFITFYLKNIHVLSMIFMKFSRFFKIFHVLSMILTIFSRFFKIFHVLFKILNDILLHFLKKYVKVLLMILINFLRFFMIFQDFSWFFSTFYFFSPFYHA